MAKLERSGILRSWASSRPAIYNVADAREFLSAQGIDAEAVAPQVDGKFISAFVRATKPRG